MVKRFLVFFPFFTPFFTFISLLHFRYRYWLSNNEIPILLFACFRLFFILSITEKLVLLIVLIVGIKIGKIQVKHKIPLSKFLRRYLTCQFIREEPLYNELYYYGSLHDFRKFFRTYFFIKHFSTFFLQGIFIFHVFYSYLFVLFLYSLVLLQFFINRFPWIYFFSRCYISFFLIFTNFSIFLPLITIYSMISRLVVFRVDNNFPTLINRLFEFTGQETKIEKVAVTRRNIKIISHWCTRKLIMAKIHLKNISEWDDWGYGETLERLENRKLLVSGKIKMTTSEE